MENTIDNTKNLSTIYKSTNQSMRTFFVVWIGQVISILGSGMTGFALGVWVYQQTGSATGFALTLLFNMLPKALVAPLAGVLADRYDRRRIMMLADTSAGIATLVVALLYMSANLDTWHIYLLTALNASASALQGPAFGAAVTQLVPKAQFGRANGLLQLGGGIGQVIAPVLAGAFIGVFGLASVLLFDMVTFLFAVATLLLVRFPEFYQEGAQNPEVDRAWMAQIRQAVRYLLDRPGLFGLTLVLALANFFVGVAEAVLTPMVLSFTSPDKLGFVLTIGGIGMMVGSLLVSVLGGGKRKVYAAFGAYALLGASVIVAGVQPSITLVSIALFLVFFFLPTVMSASQAIMQAKVAPEIQGRVFGLRMFVNTLAFAVAYLLGGPLADNIFEPWMVEGGALAGILGPVIGIGPGRGMGLMFISMGLLSVITALSAFAYPRIRRVEVELPDMVESE
jgi:MFS family permease